MSREGAVVYYVASYTNSNQVNNGTRASYGYRESVLPSRISHDATTIHRGERAQAGRCATQLGQRARRAARKRSPSTTSARENHVVNAESRTCRSPALLSRVAIRDDRYRLLLATCASTIGTMTRPPHDVRYFRIARRTSAVAPCVCTFSPPLCDAVAAAAANEKSREDFGCRATGT